MNDWNANICAEYWIYVHLKQNKNFQTKFISSAILTCLLSIVKWTQT